MGRNKLQNKCIKALKLILCKKQQMISYGKYSVNLIYENLECDKSVFNFFGFYFPPLTLKTLVLFYYTFFPTVYYSISALQQPLPC